MGDYVTKTGSIGITFSAASDGKYEVHEPLARLLLADGRGWTDWFGTNAITCAGRFPGINVEDIVVPAPNPVEPGSDDWYETWVWENSGDSLDIHPFHPALVHYPWGTANATATKFLDACYFSVLPGKLTLHYEGSISRIGAWDCSGLGTCCNQIQTVIGTGDGTYIGDFLRPREVGGNEYLERTLWFINANIDPHAYMYYSRLIGNCCGITAPDEANPNVWDLANLPPVEITCARNTIKNLRTGANTGSATVTVSVDQTTFNLMTEAQAAFELIDPEAETLGIPPWFGRPDRLTGYAYFTHPGTPSPVALLDYEIGATWLWGCTSAEGYSTD